MSDDKAIQNHNQNGLIQLAIKKGYASASDIKSSLDYMKEQIQRGEPRDFHKALLAKGVLSQFQYDFLMKQVQDKSVFKAQIQESPDSLIEGYEIMSNLGMGGMGTVYKARQIAMDRLVALKVLKEELSSSKRYVSRFLKEAKSAGRLNHQNVVNVFEVGKSSGLYYIAMEYVDGENLKSVLEKDKQVPYKAALEYTLQIGRSLIHLQKAKIIHRDIKPENIMLTKDKVAKLADLGIAKQTEDKGDTQTRKGFVVGTFEYMSPEQATAKDIDFRSDMYSLGVTLFTLLAGETPFLGSSPSETVSNIMNKQLPSLRHILPNEADALDGLLRKMTAKDRDNRFDTPAELVNAIQQTMDDLRPGRARANSSSAKKSASKGELVMPLMIIVAVLLLIIIVETIMLVGAGS